MIAKSVEAAGCSAPRSWRLRSAACRPRSFGEEVTPLTLYYLTRNHLAVAERHAPQRFPRREVRRAGIVLTHLREAARGRPLRSAVAAASIGCGAAGGSRSARVASRAAIQ